MSRTSMAAGFIPVLLSALFVSTPAAAQWKEVMLRELGIAKEFPAEPKREATTYRTAVIGTGVPAQVFSVDQDGILYRLTVADLRLPDFVARSASIYAECLELAEAEGRVLARMPQRVEDGTEFRVYGQMTSVELANNGGRKLTNCFFTKGHLYRIEAVVRPEHGNFNSNLAIRFAASLRFRLDRVFDENTPEP